MSSREAIRRNKARCDAEGQTARSKYCSACFEDKKLAEFQKVSGKLLKRHAHCKICQVLRNRLSRAKRDKKNRGGREGEGEEEEEIARRRARRQTMTRRKGQEAIVCTSNEDAVYLRCSNEDAIYLRRCSLTFTETPGIFEADVLGARHANPDTREVGRWWWKRGRRRLKGMKRRGRRRTSCLRCKR
jgi:hypothetical protein